MRSVPSNPGVYGFEAIDDSLPFIPLAARRALDALGLKLALEGWRSLSIEDRRALLVAGACDRVPADASRTVDRATPAAVPLKTPPEPDPVRPPPALLAALGPGRPLEAAHWGALQPLDRYALAKCGPKPEKLARAYDEIVAPVRLSHLSESGAARMIDVASKAVTARRAVASACLRTTPAVLEAIGSGALAKGDVLAAARIAGILAVKRTPELIPLCHPVQTTHASIAFELDAPRGELRVLATVEALDRTGVEMEAMVAASVASLTLYDMIKSADRWARVDALQLELKAGGKSGAQTRPREGLDP